MSNDTFRNIKSIEQVSELTVSGSAVIHDKVTVKEITATTVKCNEIQADTTVKCNEIQADTTVKCNEIQAITGGIIVNNSIAPNTNNTKDLGSSTNMWKDVYATRLRTDFLDGKTNPTITLQGNLTPDNNNSRTLGQADKVYSDIYTRQLGGDATIMIRPNNLDANRVQFSETYVRPFTDDQISLGLSGQKWTTVYATNGTISTSSRTKKRNIMDCMMGLEFIDKLEPKMYIYNSDPDDQPMRCGLIYEEVEDVINDMPEMTFAGLHKSEYDNEDPDTGEIKHETHYGINYESFVAPLIGAVKDLKAEIESLKAEIAILKSN